jgi:TPR repeat protein
MRNRITFRKPLLLAALLLGTGLLGGCSTTGNADKPQDPETILEEARQAYAKQEYEKVFQLVFPLAASGNAQAQYTLGYLYFNGFGIEKSEVQAMQWIQRAAAQGHKKAIQALR